MPNADHVPCPVCNAPAGAPCVSAANLSRRALGLPLVTHPERERTAARQTPFQVWDRVLSWRADQCADQATVYVDSLVLLAVVTHSVPQFLAPSRAAHDLAAALLRSTAAEAAEAGVVCDEAVPEFQEIEMPDEAVATVALCLLSRMIAADDPRIPVA
jgi:hypothetical protein